MEKTTVSKSGILKFDVRFLETGESEKIFLRKYKNQLKGKNFAPELNDQLCPAAKDFVCCRFKY